MRLEDKPFPTELQTLIIKKSCRRIYEDINLKKVIRIIKIITA